MTAWMRVQRALDEISGGRGADHIFLAAGGSSNAPVETAARLARDRARVVDIGKTRLDLPWNAYYDKELDVRFSRSYGPGRYDERYELEGIDYPIGYVRWTERRNLECFLDLIARKEIEVETLVSGVFPLENASTVYADLASGSLKAVGVLLEYPAPPADSPPRAASQPGPGRHRAAPRGQSDGRLAIGFIGAGNYASSMLLPHLARLERPTWRMSRRPGRYPRSTRSGASDSPRRRPMPTPCFEDYDPGRDLHRDTPSLARGHGLPCPGDGKAVFVEKPLALTRERDRPGSRGHRGDGQRPADGGLQPALRAAADPDEVPVRVGGSQFGHALPGQRGAAGRRQLVRQRRAGGIAVHRRRRSLHRHAELVGGQPARGGLCRQGPGKRRRAGHRAVRERFERRHHVRHGRELALSRRRRSTPRRGGRSARLDNFRKATVWSGRRQSTMRSRGGQDKGQRAELTQFVEANLTGAPMPIPVESLIATTRATIAVSESLLSGRPERV